MFRPIWITMIIMNVLATLMLGVVAENQANAVLSLMRAVVQLQLKPAQQTLKQPNYDPSCRRA